LFVIAADPAPDAVAALRARKLGQDRGNRSTRHRPDSGRNARPHPSADCRGAFPGYLPRGMSIISSDTPCRVLGWITRRAWAAPDVGPCSKDSDSDMRSAPLLGLSSDPSWPRLGGAFLLPMHWRCRAATLQKNASAGSPTGRTTGACQNQNGDRGGRVARVVFNLPPSQPPHRGRSGLLCPPSFSGAALDGRWSEFLVDDFDAHQRPNRQIACNMLNRWQRYLPAPPPPCRSGPT
jgi:hypothetical protein